MDSFLGRLRRRDWVRFDRNELAGSFGDIGTDLPLLIGMLQATRLDAASVLVTYGLFQAATGVLYGLPMAVQPLKAMAVLVIARKSSPELLHGAGLSIGLVMLALGACGLLDRIDRIVPKSVVRGIQFGLGLSLASLALKTYVPADGVRGFWLAAASLVLIVAFRESRRLPAALLVIGLGSLYAWMWKLDLAAVAAGAGFTLPTPRVPAAADVVAGFFALALPQLPLSLSNSVIATRRTADDLFPQRRISVRKIGLTYAAMNLVSPFFGGVPVCHGSGGLVGHYAFGGRTGGSVILYGCLYLTIGLFFSGSFAKVVEVFPQPALGVILLFEALALMSLVRDVAGSRRGLSVALLTGLCAFGLPQGYVIGMLIGMSVHCLPERFGLFVGEIDTKPHNS